MNRRKALYSILATIGIALAGPAAQAAADVGFKLGDVSIDINFDPPPAREESIPPPRYGYVWAPGYWRLDGYRHEWVSGRWIKARQGLAWVPDRWTPVGHRWHHEPGHWQRASFERDRQAHHEGDRDGERHSRYN